MAEVIQPALARLFPPSSDGKSLIDMPRLEKEVGALKLYEVSSMADDIIEMTAEELVEIPKLQRELRSAAGELFPGLDFTHLAIQRRNLASKRETPTGHGQPVMPPIQT
jgi:hypothetical protein